MLSSLSPRNRAILMALLVTFLWSTSFVLVKIGLREIPPLTFAGLRYTLAFLVLIPFTLKYKKQVQSIPRPMWGKLIALGLLAYAFGQGLHFWSLSHLPVNTQSLLLNFVSIIVALLGMAFLKEYLSRIQWVGIGLFLLGVILYFYPAQFPLDKWVVLGVALFGVFINGVATILGRDINRSGELEPVVVTVISMGVGSVLLLIVGLLTQGLPPISAQGWGIVVFLAVVNTAPTFTMWNHVLRTLPAAEAAIIANTMLVQIAIMAWIVLGDTLGTLEIIGLVIALVGIIVSQWRRR